MSMSMFSISPTVEHNRSEAGSALPDAPVVVEQDRPRGGGATSHGARRALARIVRRAARTQLAWACRLDAAGPAHR